MAKSTLRIGALAFGFAGVIALGFATPTWASGATSAAKKVAGPSGQVAVSHYNRTNHESTEFSSAARTGSPNTQSHNKWK
jgi:hypothetical protein